MHPPRRAAPLARALAVAALAAAPPHACTSLRRDGAEAAPASTTPRAHTAAGTSPEAGGLGSLLRAASALRARIARRELPAGVERAVRELEAAAQREAPARAREALVAAAELLAARHAFTRETADLGRADALLARAEALAPHAEACALLARRAEWQRRAGARDAARAGYLAYERRCPQGDDLAHVHASLALLDPGVARAESEAATHANARTTQREVAAILAGVAGGGAVTDRANGVRIRRVAIDPGHGGSDPGARGPTGLTESQVTLDVSRRLADRIAATTGLEVILTRDADEYVPLEARTERANHAGADLFISIHCNSADNPLSRGVSTYVLDTTSDRVAARVAARENGALGGDAMDDPEVFRILADLRLLGHASRSGRLAAVLQHAVVDALARRYGDTLDLGVHPARFHVLVAARMPAVLVELSFLSNPAEEARLRDPSYRETLARALADGLAARAAAE